MYMNFVDEILLLKKIFFLSMHVAVEYVYYLKVFQKEKIAELFSNSTYSFSSRLPAKINCKWVVILIVILIFFSKAGRWQGERVYGKSTFDRYCSIDETHALLVII